MTDIPIVLVTGILTALGLILGGLLSERRLRAAETKRLADVGGVTSNADVDAIVRRRGIPTRDERNPVPYAECDFGALFPDTPEVGTGGVVRRVVERSMTGRAVARVEYEGGASVVRTFRDAPLECRCDDNPPHAQFCRSCGRPVVPPPVDVVYQ